MPVVLFIANLFGISVFRLAVYAGIFVAVITAGLTIRQHYINVGWYKHQAKVERQDNAAVAASKRVEEKTNVCTDQTGFWDVISQSCKLEDEK